MSHLPEYYANLILNRGLSQNQATDRLALVQNAFASSAQRKWFFANLGKKGGPKGNPRKAHAAAAAKFGMQFDSLAAKMQKMTPQEQAKKAPRLTDLGQKHTMAKFKENTEANAANARDPAKYREAREGLADSLQKWHGENLAFVKGLAASGVQGKEKYHKLETFSVAGPSSHTRLQDAQRRYPGLTAEQHAQAVRIWNARPFVETTKPVEAFYKTGKENQPPHQD